MSAPACPCATGFVDPCGYACSCKDVVMSGGCRRCCQYGSDEQRNASRDFAGRRRLPVDIVEVDLATFVWTEVVP